MSSSSWQQALYCSLCRYASGQLSDAVWYRACECAGVYNRVGEQGVAMGSDNTPRWELPSSGKLLRPSLATSYGLSPPICDIAVPVSPYMPQMSAKVKEFYFLHQRASQYCRGLCMCGTKTSARD
eukprot:1418425-Rhodomonas_salina.4